jgi:nucleoside-diphosphate-sugar epimerase
VTVRWITSQLGTAPWSQTAGNVGYKRLDVRDLIDGPGNDVANVRDKIEAGLRELGPEKRIVVCCDWGASRSNAVAAGILARLENMSVAEAFRSVIAATGEVDVKADMYDVVRRALEPGRRVPAERHIAVLGGGGVLGRRWAESAEPDTLFLNRRDIDLLGDLTAGASHLGELGVTDIVLLAQPVRPFGRTLIGNTIAMTYGGLELARTIGARLVMPSSIAVFGGATDRACLTPDHPRRPRDDFGFAKSGAEALAESYAESRGVPLLIVRFPHVYGSENTRPTVLVNALEHVRRNEPITLHRFRNGLPELDLLLVDDAVRAFRKLVRTDRKGLVHVGTSRGIPVADVVTALISLAGSRSEILFELVDAETRRHALQSVDKDLLEPPGPTSLQSGLRLLLEGDGEFAAPQHDRPMRPVPLMEKQ